MSKFVKRKNIIVKSAGMLHLLGAMTGPILTPFPCDVNTILQLVITHKDVYEVLSDGTEVKLDRSNYNKVIEPTITEPHQKSTEPDGRTIVDDTSRTDNKQSNNKKNFNKKNK